MFEKKGSDWWKSPKNCFLSISYKTISTSSLIWFLHRKTSYQDNICNFAVIKFFHVSFDRFPYKFTQLYSSSNIYWINIINFLQIVFNVVFCHLHTARKLLKTVMYFQLNWNIEFSYQIYLHHIVWLIHRRPNDFKPKVREKYSQLRIACPI